jgi:hypothetical protein
MKRLVLLVLCAAIVIQGESSFAYEDYGFDPDDRPELGSDPDIRSTVRTVWTPEGSVRLLRIKFRAYERLGLYWFVTALLDSRGGPRVDYVMRLANADMSGRGCAIWPRGHRGEAVPGTFRQRGDTARCKVPASLVRRTKRIGWRLRSISGYGGTMDVAPNGGGWYR